MNIHAASHPVWGLLKYVATLVAVAFCMWLFANDFDETEVKSLITFAGLFLGGKGVESLFKKQTGGSHGR